MALGNILRGRKKFAECAEVYSKGIATIANPERPNWLIFYFRGICNERAKKWEQAEADLKQALKLYPDQPHVLNYLGYSWIDQGINLDEGMRMIRRAVEQRPDDGYIVDSLGWAYFRLGNYDEAVKNLERAVELKPDDPTINDHLGDAYAKTGRPLEAEFQWSHARDLKPEPEDLVKIKQKLANGLTEETSSAANGGRRSPTAADGQIACRVYRCPAAFRRARWAALWAVVGMGWRQARPSADKGGAWRAWSNTPPPRSISRSRCSAAAPTAITCSTAWWRLPAPAIV